MTTKDIHVAKPLAEAIVLARQAIVDQGFLLLHEINTQSVVASHGIDIAGLRQLLFFHPNYVQRMLANDPRAILHAPLKIVLLETSPTSTQLLYGDISATLAGYQGMETISQELEAKMQSIFRAL